MDNNR